MVNKHYVKNELGADTLRELVMFEVRIRRNGATWRSELATAS